MGEKNSPHGPAGIYVLPDADISGIRRKILDVPYAGLSEFQKLDVYLPDSEMPPYPVIMAVHGGAWMMCDKRDTQLVPVLKALERGYAVVSVNYRLSSESLFPAQIHDVKAAVRWIRANAMDFGFDGSRIAAWGGSAGAHLSALAGVTAGIGELEDKTLGNPDAVCELQAVVAWYGPTDFLRMDEYLAETGLGPCDHGQAGSPESKLLGAKIDTIPERVRLANPETYIGPACPPFFIQHGSLDSTVPVQHSVELARKLRNIIGRDKVFLEVFEGAEHADPVFETDENVDKVLNFLDLYLKEGLQVEEQNVHI